MIRSADQVVGGHEQVLLGAEEPEEVGLRDAGPGGDGIGRGPGVAGPGELGDGGGQHGGAALRGGLPGRNHHAYIVSAHSLTCQAPGSAAVPAGRDRPTRVASASMADRTRTRRRLGASGSLADTVLVSNRGPLAFRLEDGRPVAGDLGAAAWPGPCARWSRDRGHLGGLVAGRGRPGRGRGGPDGRRRHPHRAGRARSPTSTTWPTTWCPTPRCGSATTTCSTPPGGPATDRRWMEAWDAYRDVQPAVRRAGGQGGPGGGPGPRAGLPPGPDGARPGAAPARPAHRPLHPHPVRRPVGAADAARPPSATSCWPPWPASVPAGSTPSGGPRLPGRPGHGRTGRPATTPHLRVAALHRPRPAARRRRPSRRWPPPWPGSRSRRRVPTARSSSGSTGWSCRRTSCGASGPSTSCWSSQPHRRQRVVFVALAYPTRQGLPEYLAYQDEVESTVARINERWGTPGWTPIVLEVEDDYPRSLAALTRYDVLLVNPVRDGLNLVAKEGPLVNGRDGVLALSREAGAFDELAGGALEVNPFDVTGHRRRAGRGPGHGPRPSGRRGPAALRRPSWPAVRPTGSTTSWPPPADLTRSGRSADVAGGRRRRHGPCGQPGQDARAPSGPSTVRSAAAATSGAVSSSTTATAHGRPSPVAPGGPARRRPAGRRGRRRGSTRAGTRRPARPDHGALVDGERRPELDRQAPRVGDQTRPRPPPRPVRSATQSAASGARRQWTVTAGPLRSTSTPVRAPARRRSGDLGDRPASHGRPGRRATTVPSGADRLHARRGRPGATRWAGVRPGRGERGARARNDAGRPETTATVAEPPGQAAEHVGHAVERPGVGGLVDDGRQGAVEVGQQRGARRIDQQRGQSAACRRARRPGGPPPAAGARPAVRCPWRSSSWSRPVGQVRRRPRRAPRRCRWCSPARPSCRAAPPTAGRWRVAATRLAAAFWPAT